MANNGFINQFPYADFHELNLDWLIAKTKSLEDTTKYLLEEWSKIEVLTEDYIQNMIDVAIATNNRDLYERMNALHIQITNEYQNYCRNQIEQLKVYLDNQDLYYDTLAKGYASTALAQSKVYTRMSVSLLMTSYPTSILRIHSRQENMMLLISQLPLMMLMISQHTIMTSMVRYY